MNVNPEMGSELMAKDADSSKICSTDWNLVSATIRIYWKQLAKRYKIGTIETPWKSIYMSLKEKSM